MLDRTYEPAVVRPQPLRRIVSDAIEHDSLDVVTVDGAAPEMPVCSQETLEILAVDCVERILQSTVAIGQKPVSTKTEDIEYHLLDSM